MNRTKTKTTTLVIALLSVLLVLSLATTVALAYFSKAKTVSTTITFGAGIDVDLYFNNTVSGTTVNSLGAKWESGDWTINGGKSTVTGLNGQTSLDDFAINNPKSQKIFVAVKVVITKTAGDISAPTVTYANGTAIETDSSYTKSGYYSLEIAAGATTLITDDIELVSASAGNTAQGASFTCKIYVTAVDTNIDDLKAQIQGDTNME